MSDRFTIAAESLWLPGGWQGARRLTLADGRVAAADALECPPAEAVRWLLPGLPNLHSHAFQRAMAGHAERQGDPADSFWTWREAMYRLAGRLEPESLHAIACQLFVEMLEAGHTWVCEFHYLHHQTDGTPYDDPAAMSRALLRAAADTGIGITLLPVLYMTGGFDGRPLAGGQRRFGHDLESYLRLVESLRGLESDRVVVGMALHSLRAVPPHALAGCLDSGLAAGRPMHIHIAEQQGEVDQCLAARGARPVRWLLDHAPVDEHWCLVHATHMTSDETAALAATGATVALCPSTEANLGDGLFPLLDYRAAGGAWGIGTDSQVGVSPVEELRWLEYGQRLLHRRRNLVCDAARPSVGETLLAEALRGGRACGVGSAPDAMASGAGAGMPADLIALAPDEPALIGHDETGLLDAWLFASRRPAIDRVWAGGVEVVRGGVHHRREGVLNAFRKALPGAA
ncbi:MAG: formimidoylglutamate deiminase [Xanthomonadales bacterium]|nr:formimidoylglutamate deiminase [Xanthomonadales bacterium]